MENTDIDLLITRILEDEADAAEVAAFRDLCLSDPVTRRRFVREVALHRMKGVMVSGRDGSARFTAEVVARLQGSSELDPEPLPLRVERQLRHEIRLSRWRIGLAIAAVLALAIGLSVFFRTADNVRLSRCESAVWSHSIEQAAVGEKLKAGRVIDLESGLVELEFTKGISVLLEGPAKLTIGGPKSAFLDHGRLVARVTNPEGRGFVIDGPTGRVVDLGTAFGVSVDPANGMEVHVLEGHVNASSNEHRGSVVSLHKDEAMRMGATTSERIPADEGAFVTALPPLPGRTPGFVRWSFEEKGGDELLNSGSGLAEDRANARLRSSSHLAGPERVSGHSGMGLSFDGVDDYAESGFEGISGQAPRTVSLWARIPPDLGITESYAMVSWGRVEGQGSAWQISVNPVARDGPLGALRAGTGQAAVVGSTDLRDGKWHHLAVVMYGGTAPSTATHVLLYVDGELQSTTRKSVRIINTEPSREAHGVWIGRNLASNRPEPDNAVSFRGVLDEVQIFSAALDEPMIRRVMDGSPPNP